MTYEEAERKAFDALEAGLIELKQLDDYIQHLLKTKKHK